MKPSENNCIVCKEKSIYYGFTKSTQYGEYPILRCSICKSAFVWPRPSQGVLEDFYRALNYSNLTHEEVLSSDSNYYPDSIRDAERIIALCKRFSQGGDFLDVGAGFGIFSKIAFERGFYVSACEPNPNARKVFYKMNSFNPDSCLFDEQYAKSHEMAFDVVLLSQVLEHISDPEEMVQNIYRVLRKEGVAVIAVPHYGSLLSKLQGKKDMFISPPEHLNFFSKRGLTLLFQKCGFKLELIHTVTKMNKKFFVKHVPFAPISTGLWASVYGALKITELFNMGMVINAYFRKAE
jgi:2-polyprenyl-3-methyl-5-hydroxy-6-metoxy-1,4-benzoquinol methylase